MPLELEERERFSFHRIGIEEKERIIKRLVKLLSERGEIFLAMLHGSFISDLPFRDIDLAVYVAGDFDPLDYKFMLDEELEKEIGYAVDTHLLNDAPYYFAINVLEKGRVLLERRKFLREALLLKAFDEEVFYSLLSIK